MGYTLSASSGGSDTPEEIIPNGIYLAVLEDAKERDSNFLVNKDKPELGKEREINYKFKIIDERYPDRVVWGTTPTWFTLSEKCKFRNWVQEILNVDELDEGFDFELEQLFDMPVNVQIENKEYFSKKYNENRTATNVVNVIRYTDDDDYPDDDSF